MYGRKTDGSCYALDLKYWEDILLLKEKFKDVKYKDDYDIKCYIKLSFKKIKIISRNYFTEFDNKIIDILLVSENPVMDIKRNHNLSRLEVYRLMRKVKIRMMVFFSYFDKRSYRLLRENLFDILGGWNYVIMHMFLYHRSLIKISKELNKGYQFVKESIYKVCKILSASRHLDASINDLYIFLRDVLYITNVKFLNKIDNES